LWELLVSGRLPHADKNLDICKTYDVFAPFGLIEACSSA
jgi:hypothetical protein